MIHNSFPKGPGESIINAEQDPSRLSEDFIYPDPLPALVDERREQEIAERKAAEAEAAERSRIIENNLIPEDKSHLFNHPIKEERDEPQFGLTPSGEVVPLTLGALRRVGVEKDVK